jgi:hypothetical protein
MTALPIARAYPPLRLTSPLSTVEPGDCQQPHSSAERCECPRCHKLFSAAAVVNDPPTYWRDHGSWGVLRRLFCDHCDHVAGWLESSDSSGFRTGVLLSGPSYIISPRSVANFLKKYPSAAGVAQNV